MSHQLTENFDTNLLSYSLSVCQSKLGYEVSIPHAISSVQASYLLISISPPPPPSLSLSPLSPPLSVGQNCITNSNSPLELMVEVLPKSISQPISLGDGQPDIKDLSQDFLIRQPTTITRLVSMYTSSCAGACIFQVTVCKACLCMLELALCIILQMHGSYDVDKFCYFKAERMYKTNAAHFAQQTNLFSTWIVYILHR